MPQMPAPNSGGRPEPNNNPMSAKPAGGTAPNGGGQVKLSRAEEVALVALETGAATGDDAEAMERAMEDSGLGEKQILALKDRAEKLRRKGFTLIGAMVTFKPLSADETNALVSDRDGDGIPDDEDEDEGDDEVEEPRQRKPRM